MNCQFNFKFGRLIAQFAGLLLTAIAFAIVIIIFSSCATTQKSAKEWMQNCVSDTDVDYCVTKTGGANAKTILYLHGAADGSQSPKRSIYNTEEIVSLINKSGASHVLNISYGLTWLLKPQSGFRKLVDKIVQEKKLPTNIVGLGMSQGGSNLAVLCLTEKNFLQKCVFLNPMLLRPDQWKPNFDITNPKDPRLMPGTKFTKKEWAKYSPFSLITDDYPEMIGSICKLDEFGLYEPAKEFFEKLKVKYYEHECSHNNPNIENIKL